ncbi:hypothetical protein Naga_101578g2, partial [Nannochloropsis gaditana]
MAAGPTDGEMREEVTTVEDEEAEFLAYLAAATSKTSSIDVSVFLLPARSDFMAFQGYISLGMYQLPLYFSCETPGGRVRMSSIRGDCRLRALWKRGEWLNTGRLERSLDVGSFATELEDMLSSPLPPSLPPPAFKEGKTLRRTSITAPPAVYRQLLAELQAVGWANARDLSPRPPQGGAEDGLLTLTLAVQDSAGREHEVLVELPSHPSPSVWPRCRARLPPVEEEAGGG